MSERTRTDADVPVSVGVFDAGIGGIPIASRIRALRPDAGIVYLGDTARRPYGPQPAEAVASYVSEAERFMLDAGVDAWIIACNTASVVAPSALSRLVPVVDMVTVAAAAVPSRAAEPIGVLGTAGTVASGAYERALAPRRVAAVATEDLLRLAELGGGDDPARLERLASEGVAPLLEAGTEVMILGCTDYTAVISAMRRAVGDRAELLDPVEQAAEQVASLLPPVSTAEPRDRLCFTGEEPLDTRTWAMERWGLRLPQAERVELR